MSSRNLTALDKLNRYEDQKKSLIEDAKQEMVCEYNAINQRKGELATLYYDTFGERITKAPRDESNNTPRSSSKTTIKDRIIKAFLDCPDNTMRIEDIGREIQCHTSMQGNNLYGYIGHIIRHNPEEFDRSERGVYVLKNRSEYQSAITSGGLGDKDNSSIGTDKIEV